MVDPRGRTIVNPVFGDTMTFVETAESSDGARTVLDTELPPRAQGVPPHYHETFSEAFHVLEGELTVQLGDTTRRLGPGQSVTAQARQLHRWYSQSDSRTRFRVTVRPGHVGVQQALAIAYGLAGDGRVNRQGIPSNPVHAAVVFTLGETKLAGAMRLAGPLLGALAWLGRAMGVERSLLARYYAR